MTLAIVIITLAASTPGIASAQTSTTGSGTYAALGDSIAAGVGLQPLPQPTASDVQCGRTAQSYPTIVAARTGLSLVTAACSGAKAGDLFTKQAVSGPNIPAQLNTAYASGQPQLITITAGANDAHWASFIRTCYTTNCATQTATTIANGYLAVLQVKLYIAFSSIQLRSHGTPPPVVITGYYNPTSASCAQLQTNVTPAELTWIAGETNALNQTIQNVSRHYSFVKFVPVDFTGHDLCSSSSWVQGLADPQPFHPTAAGQAVIADDVLRNL